MVSHTICELGVPSFWLSLCVCELTTQSRAILPRALCDTIHSRNLCCPSQRSLEERHPLGLAVFAQTAAVDKTSLVITTSYHGVYHFCLHLQSKPYPSLPLNCAYTKSYGNALSVATGMAEMVTYLPISSPFIRFAGRFVDEAFGVAVGYNFFVFEAAMVPFEIVACNFIINYWSNIVPVAGMNAIIIVLYWYVLPCPSNADRLGFSD